MIKEAAIRRKLSGAAKKTTVQKPASNKLIDTIVVCLRIRDGTQVSADIAIDYHDGAHHVCVTDCGNKCVKARSH